MRWAITPGQVGKPIGWRALGADDQAGPGEFVTTIDPAGAVLAEDQHSLRAPTADELLEAAKEAKLAELVLARELAIVSAVAWSGAEWSTLPDDQANLIQAVALWTAARGLSSQDQATLGAPVPSSIPWKTIANELRDLSYLESIQLATAVSIHKQTQFGIYWNLEAAVGAASSIEAVDAIEWPA